MKCKTSSEIAQESLAFYSPASYYAFNGGSRFFYIFLYEKKIFNFQAPVINFFDIIIAYLDPAIKVFKCLHHGK